jgi:large subunit ribosomal protein L24
VHAHVDKQLREKLKIKKRTVQISKGDTVKIIKGVKKGVTGKVVKVDLKKVKVFIDSATRKNAKGKESNIPINISNVYITDLNLGDKFRVAKLNVSKTVLEAETKKSNDAKSAAGAVAIEPASESTKTAKE